MYSDWKYTLKNCLQEQKADVLHLFVNVLLIEASNQLDFSQSTAPLDTFGRHFVSSPAWLCFQQNVSLLT